MINKTLQEIIDGWSNLVIRDTSVEPIAKSRLEMCINCPNFTIMHTCKLCGCYLPAKTRSLSSQCPINKWEK